MLTLRLFWIDWGEDSLDAVVVGEREACIFQLGYGAQPTVMYSEVHEVVQLSVGAERGWAVYYFVDSATVN